MLITDIEEAEVEEILEEVRRRARVEDENDDKEFRVDELGVDGLRRDGTLAELAVEESRPQAAFRE